MEDVAQIAFDIDELVDVRLPELEVGLVLEHFEVARGAGDEVVQGEDAHALVEERLAQVRANEAGPDGDDGPRFAALITRGRFLGR